MPFAVIFFLIITVVIVPFLSIYNLKMIDAIKEFAFPSKKKMYLQSAQNQIVLTVLALWAADASDMNIAWMGSFTLWACIGGGIFLLAGFTLGYVTNRNKNIEEENPGLDLLRPQTISEKYTWVFVNMIAAVCEEIIFRGVMFQLFLRTTENQIAAAIMSALCFGFSHSVQGITGIIITTIFGLGLQHLAHLNNGLLIPMIVHFLYNMGTTFLVLNQKKQEDSDF